MKHFYRAFCALSLFVGIQQSYAVGGQTILMINSSHEVSYKDIFKMLLKEASYKDIFKALSTKACEDIWYTVTCAGALGAAWSCGRQYQLVREHGISALVSHPDSWPRWFWKKNRGLTAGAVVAGVSYLGYKMYRDHQSQQAAAALQPKPGMSDASTATDATFAAAEAPSSGWFW